MQDDQQLNTESPAPIPASDVPMPAREAPEPESEAAKEAVVVESRDLLTRLADAGEDAVRRFGKATGLTRVVTFATSTRDRLDEVATRLRGVSKLEMRVAELEEQVAALTTEPPKRKQPARSAGPGDAKA
jgi:hypothetical protein